MTKDLEKQVNNAEGPAIIFDHDTFQIKHANKPASDLYGYSKEELLEISVKDLRPKEDIAIFLEVVEESVSKEKSKAVSRHQKKNGETILVYIFSKSLEEENLILARLKLLSEAESSPEEINKITSIVDQHLKHSLFGVIVWNHDLQVMKWSSRTEEITGYTVDEVMGESLLKLNVIKPGYQHIFKSEIFSFLASDEDNAKVITKISTPEGFERDICLHFSVIKNKNSKVESLFSFVEDITEQKKYKEQLKYSEEKYRLLYESAPIGILFLKGDKIVDCNEKLTEILEAPKHEILGKTPWDFSPATQQKGEDSFLLAQKYIEKAYENGFLEFDWVHQSAKGNIIDAYISLRFTKLSDGTYLQALVKDVTKERENERKLRGNEHLFRNLFLNSPAAIVMVDHQNKVEQVNESFEKLFGYRFNELKGKELDPVIVPDKEYSEAPKMPAIGKTKKELTKEVVRIDKYGNKKNLLLSAIPVYMDGKPFKGFGMYLDISDMKKQEQYLRDSLNEKKVLLEEIHHRVKNNLAVVSSLLQLQSFKSNDESVTGVLYDCQTRVQSIAMVHELLYKSESFARISFTEYLKELIKKIQDVQQLDTKKINFSVSSDDMIVNINQAVPLALLINEIIMNAYKHAFHGRETGQVMVDLSKKEKMITVIISDNGRGLPEDFDIKESGSLGMTLIQTLIQQLKADFKINSEKGTEYKINFESSDRKGSSNLHLK